ncbi:MAG: pyridoxal-phosphate dependent enzyme [Bacteroidales bacterium]|nr:pyridoxal-phosphate dependent enzyme [Bacteroidales bacterium]MBN2698953.1 pyridoxal-phosphate dependent enzyme [Bacteroidales bacterium]
MNPTLKDLQLAEERIKPYVHRTPVMESSTINRMLNAKVYFKCENFQRMGAFKMRGATNAILHLSKEQRARGVITHSSGNFAQALALAARSLNTKAYIVMPRNASKVKMDAVRGYGAEIIESAPTLESRIRTMTKQQESTGATFIHPSNDIHVIIGNATAAMEFIEDVREFDAMIAPVGGGGLIAGTALAVNYLIHYTEVIGTEPFGADDAYLSLKTGKIQPCVNPKTIADGLRTELGDVNFPIIRKYVSKIIRVEESEIISAMKLVWERLKIVIEPSSAVAVAGLFRNQQEFNKRRVGVILSGGNVDLSDLPF